MSPLTPEESADLAQRAEARERGELPPLAADELPSWQLSDKGAAAFARIGRALTPLNDKLLELANKGLMQPADGPQITGDLVVAEGEGRAIVIPLASLPAGSRVRVEIEIGPPPPPAPLAAPVAPELPQGPRVRPMMGTGRR